jgi:hypothetical protein
MDWPVIGAFAGVTALAGTVGIGAVAMWTTEPPAAKVERAAPVLLVERSRPASRAEPAYVALPATSGLSHDSVPSLQLASRPSHLRPVDLETGDVQPPAPSALPRIHAAPAHAAHAHVAPAHVEKERKHPAVAAKPVAPEHTAPRVDKRYANVMTSSRIANIRALLRLTRDQVASWRPVEAVLHKIGRDQVAQIEHGRNPEVPSNSAMELYWAAQPLLGSLRPDQKEKVKSLARSLGYPQLASML